MDWAVEDIQRLILPQLDSLHTAGDLWGWRCRRPVLKEDGFPGFADTKRALAWLEARRNKLLLLQDPFYAARVLANDELEPLLRAWEAASQDVIETSYEAKNNLRFAAAFRALPQTPWDGPL